MAICRPPEGHGDYIFLAFKGMVYRHYVDGQGNAVCSIEYNGASKRFVTDREGTTHMKIEGPIMPDGSRGELPCDWPDMSGDLYDSAAEPTEEQIDIWKKEDSGEIKPKPFDPDSLCERFKNAKPKKDLGH